MSDPLQNSDRQKDTPHHAGGCGLDSVLSELSGGSASAPEDPRFTGYTVLQKLGEGAFGAVFRVRDDKLGREVALKVLLDRPDVDERARRRFIDEARNLARVRHPNVLTIHTVIEENGQTALVTEYLEGKHLGDLVEEQGALSAAEAAHVGVQICRALAATHAAGLVHRDVKCSNILRERGGRIVLTDFGLGVFLLEGQDAEKCGLLAGSPLFMAPEQSRGGPVDARADLYALGVVLYHLATGMFPLTAPSLAELFVRIRRGQLTPLRDARADLPEDFIRTVERALALRPEDRFQSAGQMEAALLDCCASIPEAAVRSSPWRPGRILAFTGIAASLAILAYVLLDPGSSPRRHFTASARLFLATEGAARVLTEDDRTKVGDSLFLKYTGSEPAHVYVLNEDRKGNRYLLFPLPRGKLQNPLAAGVAHELPGTVASLPSHWQVTEQGDEESFFILASRSPLAKLESLVREGALKPAGTGAEYPTLAAEGLRETFRGVGGLAPAPKEKIAEGRASLAEFVEGLKAKDTFVELGDGLWIRRITLRNP